MTAKKTIIYIFTLLVSVACGSTQKVVVTKKTVVTDTQQRQFSYFYYEGIRQKELGLYDQALESFRMSYNIDSLDAGLLAEMSNLLLGSGDKDKALSYMQKAATAEPANWWYNRRLIALYADNKQYNEAIVVARNLLQHFPEKEESYQLLGSLYKQNAEITKAIEVYNALEKITGIEESVAFEKFYLYASQNKIKKAIAEIDRLIARYPANSRYKVIRGDIFMQQKLYPEAFSIYQKVLETDPENPYIYLSLSEYYDAVGEPDKAIGAIVTALKNMQLAVEEKMEIMGQFVPKIISDTTRLDETESLFKLLVEHYPLEEQVHGYYSLFLQYRGRVDEAVNELESMLNINAKNEQTWLQLLQLHMGKENFDEVLKTATRAIAQLPEMPQWYFYKGLVLFRIEKFEEALEANKTGVIFVSDNQAPLRSDFFAQIGDINYKLGRHNEAFEAYDMSLKASPGNVYVMNNYAYYLSELNVDLKKAEMMSAKTVEKEPSNSTFLDTYAWIFFKQGNYSLAKFYIERAVDNLEADYDATVIYDHYGDILWKSGNKEKAAQMWQKAIDKGLKDAVVEDKLKNGLQ
ncbi:MAG: tetratricopeptide repeat protein [Paludibacteraceae bacterium]|nr:tetratricopeptide repeat protein [Paludibacteraceae bacterium]